MSNGQRGTGQQWLNLIREGRERDKYMNFHQGSEIGFIGIFQKERGYSIPG
jgi:hypothetical protein